MNVTVEGITSAQLGQSIGAWVQENTIAIAERALREEVDQGFDNQPVVITDGVPRKDYLLVKPFGRIEFAARPNMAEAVLWALNELQKRSPVKTGRYASTHTITLNDQEITGNIALALRNVGPNDRVQIVNPQPYARKLEGATANRKTGRGKRKPSSRQAPGGIYRPVLSAVVARYGKTLFVDYKLVTISALGVKVWGNQGGARGKHGRPRAVKRVQRWQVYPALQFFIKDISQLPVESIDVR